MAYCSFCQKSVPDEGPYCNTYCDFCGRLLKTACEDARKQAAEQQRLYEQAEREAAYRSSQIQNYSTPTSSASHYSGGGGSSSQKSDSLAGTIFTFLVIAAAAWWLLGETAAMVVIVIGVIYLLRHVIMTLIVIGVGAFGYFLAESMGFSGILGGIIGVILAAFVMGKITGD